LSVFGPIPPRTETASDLYKRDTGGCARIPKMTLGVKWSQVQMLSARPKKIGSELRRRDRYPTCADASGCATPGRTAPG